MAYNAALGFDPDKDYSALIAVTADPAERTALLQQRERKLDYLTQTGAADPNWASNRVVAAWTPAHQPGGWNDATASYNSYEPYQASGAPFGGASNRTAHTAPTYNPSAAYGAAAQSAQQAIAQATAHSLGQLEAQKGRVGDSYQELARQAYINYMQGRRVLPHQLASVGLTGGASESALVALESAYRESLYAGDLARRRALDDIDGAMASVHAQGDAQAAQAAADGAYRQAGALQAYYRDLLDERRWQTQFDYKAQQDAQTAAQQAYRRALDAARLLAGAGDFSGYRALGLDTTALEADWAARMAPPQAVRSGASPSDSAPPAVEGATQSSSVGSPVEKAARTYLIELAALYANHVDNMRLQVEEDLRKGFISQSLAREALKLLVNGSWSVRSA